MNKKPRRLRRQPAARRMPKISSRPKKGEGAVKNFPIVGIGASAGGLEAMTQLLHNLPGGTGMAFVLNQHLDPTHESALSSLLGRATTLRVCEARSNLKLEPDHLYVIPPNKIMGISRRRLMLTPRRDGRETHASIDRFLESLAGEEGNSAIGVILSGNGSDGTAGLRAIKAAGGITFAQEEKTAKYPAMPGNAIAAGCVDFVLSPENIGRELARLARHSYVAPGRAGQIEPLVSPEGKDFTDILNLLRQQVGVDFTHYKHATLRRRIHHRMVLHKLETLKHYAQYLRAHPMETKELFSNLLIHVTGFFRDTIVFHSLKKRAFPRLVKNKPAGDVIRIWVPGCSSGEEVYSIAIALLEFLQDRKLHHPLQLFGTDIDETALARARAGVYPESIQENVSAGRLRAFFTRIEGGFRINKAVREMCIFARQNVVADPPFSNLDLISCRNVLIYLGQPLQRKIFPLFQYALKPDGLLLLGSSETIGGFADLFSLTDKKTKLYTKKGARTHHTINFGPPMPAIELEQTAVSAPARLPFSIADVQKQADRILLTQYSPTGVVINRQLEVLQFRGRTGEFLEHSHGDASLDLLKMAREGLVAELRAATAQAFRQNARVRREPVRVRHRDHFTEIALEIVPFQVPASREKYYLILFEPASPLLTKKAGRRGRVHPDADSAEFAHLRAELASTRDSLQAIIGEREAANEELRSANEEIMSSNEELQSTNEELETAKEELQSTNEELTTLNEELENRNQETEIINSDLQNLLGSVNIPILILGTDLRIRRFTAAAGNTFNLIPSDVGRPITDLTHKLNVPNFSKLVLEVIESLATKEMEVCDHHQHWWSLRIRPYRTTDNKIDGAVVALLDIDQLKQNGNVLLAARDLAEAVVNTVRQPLVLLDQKLNVKSVNDTFCRVFKVGREGTVNRRIYDLGNGQWNIPQLRSLLEEILPQNRQFFGYEVKHDFLHIGPKTMLLNARRLARNGADQELILLAIEEVTSEKLSVK